MVELGVWQICCQFFEHSPHGFPERLYAFAVPPAVNEGSPSSLSSPACVNCLVDLRCSVCMAQNQGRFDMYCSVANDNELFSLFFFLRLVAIFISSFEKSVQLSSLVFEWAICFLDSVF